MSPERDDDPLSWAGDDDPTLQTSRSDAAGETRSPKQARSPRRSDDAAPAQPRQSGSVMLVVMGVLGGIYLLYTIGWALNIGRDTYSVVSPIDQIMYTVGLWLAAAAPPLWFAASLWFTRGHVKSRTVWLVIGAVMLIPWPFVIGGM
ncbi:hypothetical protein [Paramicrobacterium agarici]|uniref:hypothetical protein n=1 Tax=Paramicrobacterium agarici TaxID=630514 RepID=UPI0011502946|nr:hypothetical protein [Microbacterium agarici]TQO21496.1 hypothetical protein FB385_0301 [Microbacterium agarici]